ncbi:hypothetical protein ABEB36_006290 [Hypothenemus hampei]|uniref:Eukaryotic translation initiation factor 2A n=1 Tax=Hypothenemus hampei TaxID=57062 RepID=A0ABD1EQ29_HYPHA
MESLVEIPIFTRSSSGIKALIGPPKFQEFDQVSPIESKTCRTLIFSSVGSFLAHITGNTITVLNTKDWSQVSNIPNTKVYHIAFSPKGTYLLSWEPFTITKENPEGSPNLKIFNTLTGELTKTFIHKKQSNWEPQWSEDEKLFTHQVNNDITFYEENNFNRIVARINNHKVASYKLSPNVGTYFLLCHTLGAPGQPSVGRLFKYPKFDEQIAAKSFFQADKVEFLWNSKGNNALVLTSTDVDKTGSSYYGKQGLHFIGLNGQTAMVTMSKEGPIYSVQWSPKNHEFCVVYGFMPARATIFNLKCEPCFELGSAARNSIYYNPHGNILLLGGFGNLRGHIELWDAINKKKIEECEAPDTTLLQWAPDGAHFLTATTAPRLRTANGFKIWHYSGSLLHEKQWPQNEELYEVQWTPYPKTIFKEPQITLEKVKGIEPSQPQVSKQVYRPPSARNRPVVNFRMHEDDDGPRKVGNAPSKTALKNKKKRKAKKEKQQQSNGEGEEDNGDKVVSGVQINLTGDPEVDKKLKNIKKKLDAIDKLKREKAAGRTLETNQLTKIEGEADLLKELEQLTV